MNDLYDLHERVLWPPNFYENWTTLEFVNWLKDCGGTDSPEKKEKILQELYKGLVEKGMHKHADLVIEELLKINKTGNNAKE